MAKAVDSALISAIEQGLTTRVINVVKPTIKFLLEAQRKLIAEFESKCEAHLDSDVNSIAVGSRITTGGVINIDALRDVQIALFHMQQLSAELRVRIAPKMINNYREASMLSNQATNDVINSTEFDNFSTSAEKTRVSDMICFEINNMIAEFKGIDERFKSLERYVTDQLYHLNSLDTMVRAADKMEREELFTDARENMNINQDKQVFAKNKVKPETVDLDVDGLSDSDEKPNDKTPVKVDTEPAATKPQGVVDLEDFE